MINCPVIYDIYKNRSLENGVQKIESPSLTDLFVRQIEEMIISGKLAPGDQLPTERELASQMGVSVAVINGGIMRLAKLGFLRVSPRKGVHVEDYIRYGNAETLEVLLRYSGEYYCADMQYALLDYRRVIETRALERAAKTATADKLSNAYALVAQLAEVKDENEFSELAYEIHHELVLCGGNDIDSLIFTSFKPIYISSYRIGCRLLCKSNGKATVVSFFTRLLDAVSAGDVASALAILEASLKRWNSVFVESFSEGQRYN